MSCAQMPTLLFRADSAHPCSAVNGGATTISTFAMSFTRLRNSFTYFTASAHVLDIFQLPAMNGIFMGVRFRFRVSGFRFRVPGLVSRLGQHRHAGKRLAAEEFERCAAAGRNVRDAVG